MTVDHLAVMAPDAVAVAMCAAAAKIDARHYRIPNRLTALGAVLGFAANVALAAIVAGVDDVSSVALASLAGGGILLALSSMLWALRLIGMGDVKLLAAAGVCVRWSLALRVFVYTALAGGVIALVVAARRGVRPSGLRVGSKIGARDDERQRLPYGLAIAAGVIWAVASRYWPMLRLV